jgi:hypothetical protein
MDTPKQMNATETLAQISKYYALRCRLDGAQKLTCIQCGGEILGIRAFMSLHDERWGSSCSGPARAWRMQIPYCPVCESTPSPYGCIHMSEEELNLPSVIDASRPFGAKNPGYDGQPGPIQASLSL